MTTWYLDNDDEITDAVARLRGTDAEVVVFVVPPGSRIATGRINFKLLAREAAARDLRMAVASPDEQVRALASSAGVLAATTPDEAEAALERGDEPPRPSTSEDEPAAALTPAARAPDRGGLSWRSPRLRIVTVVVLVIALVGGFIITEVAPTAEVTLVPRVVALGPLEIPVVASVETAEVDAAAGAIPAAQVTIPLEAGGVYTASGSEITESRAVGTVEFSAPDQDIDQTIPEGTLVQTADEVAFRTTEPVSLDPSDGLTATVTAPVEAVMPGETGNVDAGEISQVPDLAGQGISVENPEATSGGLLEMRPIVTAEDYVTAEANLINQINEAMRAFLRDPDNAPEGFTMYPATVVLDPVTLEPADDAIVGQSASEFELAGSAEARVVVVDEAIVDDVVRAQLLEAVPAGLTILAQSIDIGHADGTADGADVAFIGSASGQAVTVVDPEALLEQIAGLPISDARAILEELGTTTVNVWPGFIGDLPDDRQRITLDVEEASTTE